MNMEFAIYKAAVAQLDAEAKAASEKMKALGGGTGPMGLTPDHIKFSPEYRIAYATSQQAHQKLRSLNQTYVKKFANELRAEREAKRNSRVAESIGK
jgi:hypothetical protein